MCASHIIIMSERELEIIFYNVSYIVFIAVLLFTKKFTRQPHDIVQLIYKLVIYPVLKIMIHL